MQNNTLDGNKEANNMANNKQTSVLDMMLEDAALSTNPSSQQDINSSQINPTLEQPEYQESIAQPRRTKEEEDRRKIGMFAKTASSSVLGIPGNTQSFIENMIALPSGVTPEQARTQLKKWGVEGGGHFPTSGELKQSVEKKIPSLKPENEKERNDEEGQEFFVSLLGGGAGRSIANRLIRAGVGAYTGMKVAEELKNSGASPTSQEAVKLIIGALSQTGRTSALDPMDMTRRQRVIYEAANRAGLTEAEMTPLLQGEQRARRLGAVTAETDANRHALEGAHRKAGNFFNELYDEGSNVPIPRQEVDELTIAAQNLRTQLRREHGDEAKNQTVINYLDTVIRDLETRPSDAEVLMRTHTGINRTFTENRPSQMNLLQPFNRRITRAITRSDPELGMNFRYALRLYRSQAEFIRNVGWKNLEKSWTQGTPAQNLLSTVVAGAAGSLIGHPVAGAVAGAGLSYGKQLLANQLLTNPRWQNLRNATIRALRDDSPKLAYATLNSIKERIKKENPEAYKNIDWEE